MSVIYRILNETIGVALNKILTVPITTREDADYVVAEIENDTCRISRSITRRDVQCFLKEDNPISKNALLGILDLFKIRDRRIVDEHTDCHGNEKFYKPLLPSQYLPPSFISELLDGKEPAEWEVDYINSTFSNNHRVYCIYEKDGFFSLVVLDLTSKSIFLIDPRLQSGNNYTESSKLMLENILIHLKRIQNHLEYDFATWVVDSKTPFFTYYNDPIPQAASGIFDVLCALYFLVVDVPVYFNRDQLGILRNNFAYWLLLDKELPL